MNRKQKDAIYSCYEAFSAIHSLAPSNPADIARLAQLSLAIQKHYRTFSNAIFQIESSPDDSKADFKTIIDNVENLKKTISIVDI
jgi:hypothetical protein